MKCHKPNTDQTCEVWISSEGKPYAEYIIPPDIDNDTPQSTNILETFVPVADGEQVTINIVFEGTVLRATADVLADGAFVYNRSIECDKQGNLKYQRRVWNISDVYHVPDEDASLSTGTAVLGGNLFVKSLVEMEKPLYIKNRGKLGLGTIAVIISTNQDSFEVHTTRFQHQGVGKWREIRADQADAGIKPEHELEFRLEDDEVHFNRQARHKRQLGQTRPGLKPWALFVFHYRSQFAIQQAGCVARPTNHYPLPSHLGDFTFADPDEIKNKRLLTRAKNEREKSEAAEGFYDGNESNPRSASQADGLFVSQSPSETQAPASKPKLLGQSLGGAGGQSYGTRRDSGVSQNNPAAFYQQAPQPEMDWQGMFGDDVAGDVAQVHHGNKDVAQAQDLQNTISAPAQTDDFDFGFYNDMNANDFPPEIDQFIQASGANMSQQPGAAPVANMCGASQEQNEVAPYAQEDIGHIAQSVEQAHQQHPQSQLALPLHQPTQPEPQQPDTDDDEPSKPHPLSSMISGAVEDTVRETKAAKAARIVAKSAKKERPPPGAPPAPKGKAIKDPRAETGYGYAAPTRQAMQQLDAQDRQMQGMVQNYLQGQTQDQAPGQRRPQAPPPTSNPQQQPPQSPRRQQFQPPRQQPEHLQSPNQRKAIQSGNRQTQYPMSPPNRMAQPNTSPRNNNNNIPPSPQPVQTSPRNRIPPSPQAMMQASPRAPTNIIPRKRSASVTSHPSQTSTSSKLRASEIAARRASLQARVAEKQKAKEAASQQLEAERRAREEMERRRQDEERLREEANVAAEAELAALEEELAREEGEEEAIREQGRVEAEEARMRELEFEREGMAEGQGEGMDGQ